MTARNIFIKILEINKIRKEKNLEMITDLTLGQPHLPINPIVIEEINKFLITQNCPLEFGYSPAVGRQETREAIYKLMQYYFSELKIDINHTMCTNGANQAIWNALKVVVNKNDEVILFCPYFGQYINQLNDIGAKIYIIDNTLNSMRPDLKALSQVLQTHPKIKCILLNNPVNPSGIVWSREELLELANLLSLYPDVIIIQDEVYRDITQVKFYSLLNVAPELFNRVITIFSGSKGLIGAPDIRVGMVLGNHNYINKFSEMQMLVTAEVSLLSQIALQKAIQAKLANIPEHKQWESTSIEAYSKNIQFIKSNLKNSPFRIMNECQGGFFMLINCEELINNCTSHIIEELSLDDQMQVYNDVELVHFLINNYNIACLPGSAFGINPKKGIIRVSCATSFENVVFFVNQLFKVMYDFKLLSENLYA